MQVGAIRSGGSAKSKGDTATLALPPVSNLREEPRQWASGSRPGPTPFPFPRLPFPRRFSAVDETSIIAIRRGGAAIGGVTYHERVFVRLHRDEALAERLKDKERVIHGDRCYAGSETKWNLRSPRFSQ